MGRGESRRSGGAEAREESGGAQRGGEDHY
jgi:hypothetical protein